MGSIALAACICFIIILFIIDNKKRNKPLGALWLPLLYLLFQCSRPIVLWLNPGGKEDASSDNFINSLPDTLLLLFLYLGGICVLLKRKLRWTFLLKNNKFLFFFFLYCGISILWADFPIVSLKAWLKMLIQPLMALIILTDDDSIDALITTVKRMAFILLPLSIVLIKYYPVYGRYYTLGGASTYGGVTTYKNSLGALCMFTGLLILWDLMRMLRDHTQPSKTIPVLVNISLIAIIIWLMVMADSATSLATLIIGSLILLLFNLGFMKTKTTFIKVTLTILVITSSVSVFFPSMLENVATMLDRDPTLTGRTIIWERVLSVDTNPMLGTGYSNFWQGERAAQLLDVNQVPLNQAHNGYLEVYKNLGLIGLILLGLTLFTSISKVSNELLHNNSLGMLQIAYITSVLLSNVTEASYGIKGTLWFIFILISIKCPTIMKEDNSMQDAVVRG